MQNGFNMKFVRKYWVGFIISLTVFIPLFLWISWVLTPTKKLVISIIDKTAVNGNMEKHAALNWILKHEKISKTSSELYKNEKDYFGFFPKGMDNYVIKGLENKTEQQLYQLSKDCDMAYIADVYGVYKQEWFQQKKELDNTANYGMLYGGLSMEDMIFLKRLKQQKKLIVTELNTIETPTPLSIRNDFEKTFGVKWTGWLGRYFYSFDTTKNKDIPRWIITNYQLQHNNQWPFKYSGIVLIHESNQIEILEENTHLIEAMPKIYSATPTQYDYDLPKNTDYPYWFSIILPDTNINKTLSYFSIVANALGEKLLNKLNIPQKFPAIIYHNATNDYQFYYLCGDFCSSSPNITVSYFKWIEGFKSMLISLFHTEEKDRFFWQFYRPLITSILRKYNND